MYDNYIAAIQYELLKEELSFKHNKFYNDILEHVPYEAGEEYIRLIIDEFGINKDEIEQFCRLNDATGKPNMFVMKSLNLECSTTSLRYIYHAHLILKYIKEAWPADKPLDVVEVGGGYGGLCLALHYFSGKAGIQINSYSIVDLPDVIKLQKRYLSQPILQSALANVNADVRYHDATLFGKDIDKSELFFVSNYAYSEIPKDLRIGYNNHLILPKVASGFLVWNFEWDNFPAPLKKVEYERPQTGGTNRFLYF